MIKNGFILNPTAVFSTVPRANSYILKVFTKKKKKKLTWERGDWKFKEVQSHPFYEGQGHFSFYSFILSSWRRYIKSGFLKMKLFALRGKGRKMVQRAIQLRSLWPYRDWQRPMTLRSINLALPCIPPASPNTQRPCLWGLLQPSLQPSDCETGLNISASLNIWLRGHKLNEYIMQNQPKADCF